MRTITILITLLLAGVAHAAPPSSTLSGAEGTLKWTVTPSGGQVQIEGQSPKWTVSHTANADLTPVKTTRTDAEGVAVTVEYTSSGATVTLPKKTVTHDEPGIWDGDTVDIRLGQSTADGNPEVKFKAVDTASGKVYGFQSELIGTETCGDQECTHVKLTLSGMLKAVGPKFNYWFASDGKLLKFEGPIGTYTAE